MTSYNDMSVAELRQETKKRDLGTGKSKAELVAKLEQHDLTQVPEEDPSEAVLEAPAAPVAEEPVSSVEEAPEPVQSLQKEPEYWLVEGSETLRFAFPLTGELTSRKMDEFRALAYTMATEAGYSALGGLSSALYKGRGRALVWFEIGVRSAV